MSGILQLLARLKLAAIWLGVSLLPLIAGFNARAVANADSSNAFELRTIAEPMPGLAAELAVRHVAVLEESQAVLAQTEAAISTSPSVSSDESGSVTRDGAPVQAIGADPGQGYVRLPGHVSAALAHAVATQAEGVVPLSAAASAASQPLTLTFVLKRDDQAGFDRYLHEVYEPKSKNYRRFLTQAQIAKRFGPSRRGYGEVLAYLKSQGFEPVEGSANRMTLSVRGTRADAERAFVLHLRDYQLSGVNFYANDGDPALPIRIALRVLAIDGLSTAAQPQPAIEALICGSNGGSKAKDAAQAPCRRNVKTGLIIFNYAVCGAFGVATQVPNPIVAGGGVFGALICGLASLSKDLINAQKHMGRNATGVQNAAADTTQLVADGTGQTIGLLEFDGFNPGDVSDYLALTQAAPTQINNLAVVPVNGGVTTPGSGEGEVLLDIDAAMTVAPGAKVAVYEAPFDGHASSYAQMFNAMVNGGVNVISNSWASCEDQVSLAEAQSIDAVLQSASASGISTFNGAGDSGSTCLDGSTNTVAVPADSPNAVAVGGTSALQSPAPGYVYNVETWWDGSAGTPVTGQSGFGVSKFFTRPSYQNGVSATNMRSLPDVVVSSDPADGIQICQADNGGCPNGLLTGGTSLAAPIWAAFAARLNQAQGQNLGALNPLLYPLAGTDAFHGPVSLGSDFAHVGLGSPNINVLNRMLLGRVAGPVSADVSRVAPFVDPDTGVLADDGTVSVPADGNAQGGVRVTLVDGFGDTLAGKTISLTASGGSATITPATAVTTTADGAAVFIVTDLTQETVSFTATDITDGTPLTQTAVLTFGVPPAASASLNAFPTSVTADGNSSTSIIITLKDSLGRPTPGKLIDLSQGSGNSIINGPAPAVTGADGTLTFTATDENNETVTYTATDVTDGDLPIPGSGVVTFSAGNGPECPSSLPVAGPGYAITSFATGFVARSFFYSNINLGCSGASNPAFDASGAAFIADFPTGELHKLGATGGTSSNANLISTIGLTLGSLVFGADGNLYGTHFATGNGFSSGDVVQIDQTTGAITRVLASGLTCPFGLAVDPLSSDLFFTDQCFGAGSDNPAVLRISGVDSSTPTLTTYATLPFTPNGSISFAPNGTLYVVSGYNNTAPSIIRISGTNVAGAPTLTTLSGVTTDNLAASVGKVDASGEAQTLIVHNNNTLQEVDITTATPTVVNTIATGNIGGGSIGPDGCFYNATFGSVFRVGNSASSCGFSPTNPGPTLTLTPATVAPNPPQGSSQSFTATLKNVGTSTGVPVMFTVSGVNPQTQLVRADANGVAVFTYVAVNAGQDTIVATAPNGMTVTSPAPASLHAVSRSATLPVTKATGTARAGTGSARLPAGSNYRAASVPAYATHQRMMTENTGVSATSPSSAATTLTSNPAKVIWAAEGLHVTSLTLDPGPSSGTANLPVTVIASLVDISTNPISVLPNQTVRLALARGGNCTAITDVNGIASCVLTPTAAGADTVTANFDATTQYVASSATVSFNVLVPAASGGTSGGTSGGGTTTGGTTGGVSLPTVTVKASGGAFGWPMLLLLGLLGLLRRPLRGGLALKAIGLAVIAMVLASSPVGVHADDSVVDHSVDHLYAGVRAGSMQLHLDTSDLNARLAAEGYPGVQAKVDRSAAAGTVYLGYQLIPYADVEFGYSYRDATVTRLNGSLPASTALAPLLKDSTQAIRGYGDIYALSIRLRGELLPGLTLNPRVGGFLWDSKTKASGGGSGASTTHSGGGITLGAGLAYRIWRGLELGGGVDYFRGDEHNDATLYGGTVEWRFGA